MCLVPIPMCYCESNCGVTKKIIDIHNVNQLMQFLMGLNEGYDVIRNQILVMEPLPSISNRVMLYLGFTRPDISHLVQQFSQFFANLL